MAQTLRRVSRPVRIGLVVVLAASAMMLLPRSRAGASSIARGVWTVTADGVVTSRGGAPFLGDLRNVALARSIVGMAATPSGGGYWLVGSDGGIFAFGDAAFRGSTGA